MLIVFGAIFIRSFKSHPLALKIARGARSCGSALCCDSRPEMDRSLHDRSCLFSVVYTVDRPAFCIVPSN
jgi:hypothetical protein